MKHFVLSPLILLCENGCALRLCIGIVMQHCVCHKCPLQSNHISTHGNLSFKAWCSGMFSLLWACVLMPCPQEWWNPPVALPLLTLRTAISSICVYWTHCREAVLPSICLFICLCSAIHCMKYDTSAVHLVMLYVLCQQHCFMNCN